MQATLADFSVRSIGSGADAQGWADVRLSHDDVSVHGSGVDTDIVHASAKAYLDALIVSCVRPNQTPSIARPQTMPALYPHKEV
ncbi:alpha-isopropylmalate synthase regulatory domain-containing protein [Iodidimonas nitroreducens]|uniref:alpha-isopropylmalate synthase regulatory domain-containing protein n=1 Tax=Iodidimonas nitroreducens TaxID=1236968 RepID=UPI0036F25C34